MIWVPLWIHEGVHWSSRERWVLPPCQRHPLAGNETGPARAPVRPKHARRGDQAAGCIAQL